MPDALFSPDEFRRLRAETPGVENVVHFNNAGAALMPAPVVEATIEHLQREAAVGGYEAAEEAEGRQEDVYDAIAELINSHREEIALTENATRAWDMAFYAIGLKAGDRILTGTAEYASNYLAYLQIQKLRGVRIDVVPDNVHGQVDVEAMEKMIDGSVALISLTHVPTNGGLVNPAEEVGTVARNHGIPFLLDACQSAGQIALDVDRIGCDMLSATGRKYLRGPRGTGFLFVRKDMIERLDPPFIDLHAAEWTSERTYTLRSDARRFEGWESAVAARLGLGAAVRYALGIGMDRIEERVAALAQALRMRLQELPGVRIRDRGARQSGIVSFTCDGMEPEVLRRLLRDTGFNVSVSPRSSTLLDAERRKLPAMVRASVHYYNTMKEVDRFTEELRRLLRE
jgi:cysteine desulfurase / selenocysteine lyase